MRLVARWQYLIPEAQRRLCLRDGIDRHGFLIFDGNVMRTRKVGRDREKMRQL
jgi:hypothetical protein